MEINRRFAAWAKISFGYFVLIGFLGALLRYVFIQPVPGVNYKYFLHAHSHAAFLGWIFNALYVAIVADFIPGRHSGKRKYRLLFVLLQISVAGMLLTFPLKGYYRDSIIFSTLHVLLSYVFAIYVFRDGRTEENRNTVSFLAIKISLIFMAISSLGPFALGVIMAKGLSDTHWYNLAIYYYLHFQYNGWFVFAILGLFFRLLENRGIIFSRRKAGLFIWLMAFATVPAYALSALWVPPPREVFAVGFAAGAMQLGAAGMFVYLLRAIVPQLKSAISKLAFNAILLSLLVFILKNILQFASAFEQVSLLAYQTRNYVIAYLHMTFIGFCSLFLTGWFIYKKWMPFDTKIARASLVLFFVFFAVSELILVLYPTLIMLKIAVLSNYVHWIFIATVLMAVWLLGAFIAGFYSGSRKFKDESH